MTADFRQMLSGGDLRSIGQSKAVSLIVADQGDFDAVFKLLFDPDRIVVMRSADAIEKITLHHPEYLAKHTSEILALAESATNKELVWHLAQLISRLHMDHKEFSRGFTQLKSWLVNKTNSRIVRANAIEALYKMANGDNELKKDLEKLITRVRFENIPSLNARIKKCRQLYCPDKID